MTRARVRAEEPKAEGIGFGEPPPPKGAPYDWAKIAKRLRRNPGKWLLVFREDKTSYTNAIRQGAITALAPNKGFSMRTENNRVKVSPRVCDLWMVYNPDDDTTEEK